MKKYLTAFLVLFASAVWADDDMDRLRKITETYKNIRFISASITQQVYDRAGGELLEGEYSADSRGFFRIDYMRPERQVVVNNGEGLFWYYTERDTVFISGVKPASAGDLNGIMARLASGKGALPKIRYRGTRFYSFFKRAHVYVIEFPGSGNSVCLWVDSSGRFVIRKYVMDRSGREISKETYSGHRLFEGVYLPLRIELTIGTVRGRVRTITEYSNITVNKETGTGTFDFKIRKSMTVRRLDES